MVYSLLKPLLFKLPPEVAHEFALEIASLCPALGKISGANSSDKLSLKVGSLTWKSPVGLAAGLDKNAEALNFFGNQGFGAIECGTVTLRPQLGNPRPRIFRYEDQQSLRNAMGFPNQGLITIAARLKSFRSELPIGANIGMNKDSSPDDSIDELGTIVATLQDDVDYFVVNVSSPNTPGLRALQEKSYLTELFQELSSLTNKDLFLKIAPDLEENKVVELATLATDLKLTGLIATNTTIRSDLGAGGISGLLLREKAIKVREQILKLDLPIEVIGVGGISCFEDIKKFWRDGGKAVQVYTAYVYQGPQLLKDIHKEMMDFLAKKNLKSLNEFFMLDRNERSKLLD
jgi:dihydroorotate dehydrogenase